MFAVVAQLAERVLGKNEVLGSTPNDGSLIQLILVAEMVEWSNTRVCKTRGASLRRFEPCSRHHKYSPLYGENIFMVQAQGFESRNQFRNEPGETGPEDPAMAGY